VWTGVALRDVLMSAGIGAEARHVAFSGRDRVARPDGTIPFGASIPIDKACSPEVLLAYELNGAPLPPIHGFPLRVVVPGYIGARSVKWLEAIHLQEAPSDNHFQARAYRSSAEEPLTETPVNAVIWQPAPGETLAAGRRTVQGWAMGQGGGAVAKVEVSADGGVTWRVASLREPAESWSWRFWEAAVDLVPGSVTLVVRATDAAGHTQPAGLAALWNPKGYANHAWHRVTIEVTT
jgi:sulfite oxidase